MVVSNENNSLLERINGSQPLIRNSRRFFTLEGEQLSSIEKEGIRRASVYKKKAGIYSIVIPFGNKKQILRITREPREQTRPDFVLKPLKEWEENGLRFEVFPELEILTADHPKAAIKLEMLHVAARACGYVFFDAKPENVGLLHDGTPVIVDQGAYHANASKEESFKNHDILKGIIIKNRTKYLQKIDDSQQPIALQILEIFVSNMGMFSNEESEKIKSDYNQKISTKKLINLDSMGDVLKPYPENINNAFASKQVEYVKSLGLEYGKIEGVFSDQDLEKEVEEKNISHSLAKDIKVYGLDKDLLKKITDSIKKHIPGVANLEKHIRKSLRKEMGYVSEGEIVLRPSKSLR